MRARKPSDSGVLAAQLVQQLVAERDGGLECADLDPNASTSVGGADGLRVCGHRWSAGAAGGARP